MAETVLCLLHTEADGKLSRLSTEAVGAAKSVPGATLIVGIIGAGAAAAADQLADCGASRMLSVTGPDFEQPRYGTDAAAAAALCKAAGAGMVIAPASSRFSRVMAGVARRLSGRFDSHVTGISAEGGKVSVNRWYYRQRMEGSLTRQERPWIITVDPGSFPAWSGNPGKANLEQTAVEASAEAKNTAVTGIKAPAADEQTIRPDADLLFVAGAGWTKKQPDGNTRVPEAADLILSFIKSSKASLGGSKSVVDMAGEGQAALPFMTHLNQVGQTGSTPRHPKGLATCCHGEEPHVVGWRFIGQRRAVNLDAGCGWAKGKADVLYVADAFQVIGKLNQLLASSQG